MQRLALFDLDNTLIDLDAAFRVWAEEFVKARGLGLAAMDDLIALGGRHPHRDAFFGRVLPSARSRRRTVEDQVDDLSAGPYRVELTGVARCHAGEEG